MDQADRAFASHMYDEAARRYEEYLAAPKANQPDRALFLLGLSHALRPAADWQSATNAFKQLAGNFPDSPLNGPATLILDLHANNLDLGLKNLALDSKNLELNSKNLELNSKNLDLNSKNMELRSELDQTTAESKKNESKIKQLSTELDKLKKIDTSRRKRP
jgi:hypothetical protein